MAAMCVKELLGIWMGSSENLDSVSKRQAAI